FLWARRRREEETIPRLFTHADEVGMATDQGCPPYSHEGVINQTVGGSATARLFSQARAVILTSPQTRSCHLHPAPSSRQTSLQSVAASSAANSAHKMSAPPSHCRSRSGTISQCRQPSRTSSGQ